MNIFLLNILLAIAWGALTGQFYPVNLLFGFLLGFLVLWIILRDRYKRDYFYRVPKIIEFLFFFMSQLFLANLRVAKTVLSPQLNITPGVIGVPLEAHTDAEITLLMSLITLTPGTLSLDISSDQRLLFVHTIDYTDAGEFRTQIKEGFERRVMEIMR